MKILLSSNRGSRVSGRVCDAQLNSLKIITSLSETARFLSSVGKLYDAFSVHKKGQSPAPRTLPEATEKVKECKQILAEYEKSVRSVPGCSKMTLSEWTPGRGVCRNCEVGRYATLGIGQNKVTVFLSFF